jgi:hypothetical protein
VTLTLSTAAQGSRSNLVLLAGKGGQPLGFGYVTNRGRIFLTRQSDFFVSAESSVTRSKAKRGVLGNMVQSLSAVAGKAVEVAAAGLSQAKDAATTVVQVAADAAADGVWNGATGNGGDEEGDGEGGDEEDPMVAELPGGIVIPGVRTVTVMPADPTLNTLAISQLDVITVDSARFSVSDAGIIRNGLVYGSAGPARIAGLGRGGSDGLVLSSYTGFSKGMAVGTGDSGGINLRRGLLPERGLELFQSPGTLPSANPVPDLVFDAVDPGSGGLEIRTTGTSGKGPVIHSLQIHPKGDEWVADFALTGLVADAHEVSIGEGPGTGTTSSLAPGGVLRLRGGARLIGMRSDLPVLGERTAGLGTRLLFDRPLYWIGEGGRTNGSGHRLTVRTVFREPALMLGAEPAVFVRQPQFGSVSTALRPQRPIDRGDAPPAAGVAYPEANHGIVSGLRLGRVADAESFPHTDALALGDDSDGLDDDDGVFPAGPFQPGGTADLELRVVAPPAGAFLDAFADWNRDQDWDDAGERLARSLRLTNGWNRISVEVPPGASNGVVYSRFRLSSAGGLGASGPAPDGEVEDYRWLVGTLLRPARIAPVVIAADGRATVRVDADPGSIVTVESTTSLDGGAWSSERPPVASEAGSTVLPADAATADRRFFRVRIE